MDVETFAAGARALAAGAELRVQPEARPHGFLPGRRTYVEVVGAGPEAGLALFHGSFEEAAAADPAFDLAAELERAVRHGLARLDEERAAAEAVPDDDALFEAHARFRRGLPLPDGWYRRGEALAPGVWVVDLDVFVEVTLRTAAWEAVRGTHLVLAVLDDELAIDLEADAAVDEVWTLSDCGLFEPAPGVEEEDLEALGEDDEMPGRFGDLHVVPYAF